MLATTVNLPTRRGPSPQIRARDTSLDGPTNGTARLNSAPNGDAGINGAPNGGLCCSRLKQQPKSIRPDVLEPPREIGLDRMIARVVRELTDIGNADLRLRTQLQIAARFDER